jgi:predicted N-acyltransferase
MKAENRRKAKRVGMWLKVATNMLKSEDLYFSNNFGMRTYSVNYSRPFLRKDFIKVIEKNKKLLRELLNAKN